MPLTDTAIKNAKYSADKKSGNKNKRGDGGGLYLEITPTS